jgi:hypothetical protein
MEIDPSDPSGRVQTVQRPVYYISEVLHDAKTRYVEVHKLLYVVLIASRKLRFQAHKILVVTSYQLKAMLHNPNAIGNIAKWVAKLAEFELDFLSRHAVKSQAMADLVADWTLPLCNPGGRMIVSQNPRLRFSLSLTGRSSLMAPHASKVPERGSCS